MFSNGVKRELTWVTTTLWVFLFFCWLTNLWIESLIVYLLLYIGRMLWSMRQFEKWMDRGSKGSFPPSSGFWSELSYLVSKKQRALETHADMQLYKSEQFKAASMLIPDAIVSLDQNNRIEWFNSSSETALQIRRQDIGSSIETLLRFPEFIDYLKKAQFNKPLITHSLQNSSRIYSLEMIEYFDNHKLLIAQDVSDFYNLAQIRRDFIANASHELRTPLTVLKGYLEAMVDTPGTHHDMWLPALKSMEDQSTRMQLIIEDLLTLSKMESETTVLREGVVPVPELLRRLKQDAEQLSQGQHQFEFLIEDDLCISGAKEPLKSVFTNLVSNAVRYTPDGGAIKVTWSTFADQGACFKVEDSGIGIESKHIPRVTERFYRVNTARSRVSGGTGLGLAIVKHVLERHNAELKIESVVGEGSTFICYFPSRKVVCH